MRTALATTNLRLDTQKYYQQIPSIDGGFEDRVAESLHRAPPHNAPTTRQVPISSLSECGIFRRDDLGHIPIIPFYKRGCQDKCFPCDGKAQRKWSCRPAPAMERDAVCFPFPQIHRALVTTPFG